MPINVKYAGKTLNFTRKLKSKYPHGIPYNAQGYPENNYLTVDCYTCGEEGDPLSAINNLIKTLDDLVCVEDSYVKFFKRGEFNKSKALVDGYDFVNTEKEEYEEMQKKLDNISKSLTAEQVKELQNVLNFTAYRDYS